MLTFLYCLNLKKMIDREIYHINQNLKHHGKYKFAFKLIRFLTVSNLFTIEVVRKCQRCQLCVLWENSNWLFGKLFQNNLFRSSKNLDLKCVCSILLLVSPLFLLFPVLLPVVSEFMKFCRQENSAVRPVLFVYLNQNGEVVPCHVANDEHTQFIHQSRTDNS